MSSSDSKDFPPSYVRPTIASKLRSVNKNGGSISSVGTAKASFITLAEDKMRDFLRELDGRGVEGLDFAGKTFTPAGVRQLSSFLESNPSIKKLNLANAKIELSEILVLIEGLGNIQELDLSSLTLNGAVFRAMRSMEQLESLTLENTKIGPKDGPILMEYLGTSHLKILNIDGYSGVNKDLVKVIAGHSTLTSVNLGRVSNDLLLPLSKASNLSDVKLGLSRVSDTKYKELIGYLSKLKLSSLAIDFENAATIIGPQESNHSGISANLFCSFLESGIESLEITGVSFSSLGKLELAKLQSRFQQGNLEINSTTSFVRKIFTSKDEDFLSSTIKQSGERSQIVDDRSLLSALFLKEEDVLETPIRDLRSFSHLTNILSPLAKLVNDPAVQKNPDAQGILNTKAEFIANALRANTMTSVVISQSEWGEVPHKLVDQVLTALESTSRLESITVQTNKLTSKASASIAATIAHNSDLHSLQFIGFTAKAIDGIADAIEHNQAITEVKFKDCDLTNIDGSIFRSLTSNSHITKVDLSGSTFSNSLLIDFINNHPELAELRLNPTQVNEELIANINQRSNPLKIQLNSIKNEFELAVYQSLNPHAVEIGFEQSQFIESIARIYRAPDRDVEFQTLYGDNRPNAETLKSLKSFFVNSEIDDTTPLRPLIDFESLSSKIARYDFKDLVKVLKDHRSLTILHYNHANSPKKSKITTDFSSSKKAKSTTEKFLETNPKRMDLHSSNTLFKALAGNPIIEEFSFDDVRIHNETAMHLVEALNSTPHLVRINFSKLNIITNDGESSNFGPLQEVGKALAKKSLTHLNLDASNIAADFVRNLEENSSLRYLALSNSSLYAAAQKKFLEFIKENKLPNLTHLKIDRLSEDVIEALKTNIGIKSLTIDTVSETNAEIFTKALEDGSITLDNVKPMSPKGALTLLQSGSKRKAVLPKIEVLLADIPLDDIAESLVAERDEQEIIEYLSVLQDLGFDHWNHQYSKSGKNILEIILQNGFSLDFIKQIIDMMPEGEASNVGLTADAITLIASYEGGFTEFYDILVSLNKFTNVPLFSLALQMIEGLRDDILVDVLIEAHPEMQNPDILLELAKNTSSLEKFEKILALRQEKCGVGLENEQTIISRLGKFLNNESYPLIKTLKIIDHFGFNLWGFSFMGKTFTDILLELASDNTEIIEILDILPEGDAAKAGLANDAVNIIVGKELALEELYHILEILSRKFAGIDLQNIAREILTYPIDLPQFLDAHEASKTPKILTELASAVHSLKQYSDLMTYRKVHSGIGLDSEIYRVEDVRNIGRLLLEKDIDEYVRDSLYSDLARELATHSETKRPDGAEERQKWDSKLEGIKATIASLKPEIPTAKLLIEMMQNLGFNGWGFEFLPGKNIVNLALAKTANITELLDLLERVSSIDAIVINYNAINAIVEQSSTSGKDSQRTIENVVTILSKVENFDLTDLIKLVQSSPVHIQSTRFMSLVSEEKAQKLLSVFVENVASFGEFIRLQLYAQDKFHISASQKIGPSDQKMVKYLPFSITNFRKATVATKSIIVGEIDNSIDEGHLTQYIGSLKDAGFNIWNLQIPNQQTFLDLVLQKINKISDIQKFLQTALSEEIDLELNDRAVETILSKPVVANDELIEIVKTFHKFEKVDWVAVTRETLSHKDVDFDIPQLIQIHEELQDATVLTKLAGQVYSLKQYHEIMLYRQQHFKIGLEHEDFRIRDLNNIKNLIENEEDPLLVFRELVHLEFNGWGRNGWQPLQQKLFAKATSVGVVKQLLEVALGSNIQLILDENTVGAIFAAPSATGQEFQDIVKTFHKFEKVDWVKVASSTLSHQDTEFHLYTLINLHEELQDATVLTKLAGEVHSLKQYVEIMQYRAENLGVALNNEAYRQQDLENIQHLLDQERNPLLILRELTTLDFNPDGTDEGKNILNKLLEMCNGYEEVRSLLDCVKENNLPLGIDAAGIDIILSKSSDSHSTPQDQLGFFIQYTNFDSSYAVTKILETCNDLRSVEELLNYANSNRVDFNINAAAIDIISLKLAGNLTFTQSFQFFDKYLNVDKEYLTAKFSHLIVEEALQGCRDLKEVEVCLAEIKAAKQTTTTKYKYKISHAAIDAIFLKPPAGHVTIKGIIRQFEDFEIDWVKVVSKVLTREHVDGWLQHHILPNSLSPCDLLDAIPSTVELNSVAISKLVEKVGSLEEFKTLMTNCVAKFGRGPDLLVGEAQDHMITFLPRRLVDFTAVRDTMVALSSPIDWKSTNKAGEPLFVKMIERVNTTNIESNIRFLLSEVKDVDWTGSLAPEGKHDNLLLAIASCNDPTQRGGDLRDIWNLIVKLLSEVTPEGLPKYNVNYQNKPGTDENEWERLIDKAKRVLGGILDGLFRSQGLKEHIEGVIQSLRNAGSVEPKQFIIKDNLSLDLEHLHSTQNKNAIPLLHDKLEKKYNLTAADIDKEIAEMFSEINRYIEEKVTEEQSIREKALASRISRGEVGDEKKEREDLKCGLEEYRKLIDIGVLKEVRSGWIGNYDPPGITTTIKALLNLGREEEGYKWINEDGFRWSWKIELALLYRAATEYNHLDEFWGAVRGVHSCNFGVLANLWFPLHRDVMDDGVETVDYKKLITPENIVLIYDKTLEKLKAKVPNTKINRLILEAFTNFREVHDDSLGPENWKMETQALIGAFNEAFSEGISQITGRRYTGVIESYHYKDFLDYFVVNIICDSELFECRLTSIYFAELNVIAEAFLAEVLDKPQEVNNILQKFSKKYNQKPNLQYLDNMIFNDFIDNVRAKGHEILVLRAFNNKVNASYDITKYIKSTLDTIKKEDFLVALKEILETGNESLLKNFGNEWQLDVGTFNLLCPENFPEISKIEELLLLNQIQTHVRKKDHDTSKLFFTKMRLAKKEGAVELAKSILDDIDNAVPRIDHFLSYLNKLDLDYVGTELVIRLLQSNNQPLLDKLLTDDNIDYNWSQLVGNGENTVLLLQLLNTAKSAPAEFRSEDKISSLEKANTENLVVNLCSHPEQLEDLVESFIRDLGPINLTILDAASITRLFDLNNPELIRKVVLADHTNIDWTITVGEDGETLLYSLAHKFNGEFEEVAKNLFDANSANEVWVNMHHEVLETGHVGELFGKF